MSYELCPICKEVNANPLHVQRSHGMSWSEFQTMIKDPEFMKDVERHRKENKEKAEKEYHLSRLLMYNWFPKTTSLVQVMNRYRVDADKTKAVFNRLEIDLTEYDNKDEASVGELRIAEALQNDGWECLRASGGHDGTPKHIT